MEASEAQDCEKNGPLAIINDGSKGTTANVGIENARFENQINTIPAKSIKN